MDLGSIVGSSHVGIRVDVASYPQSRPNAAGKKTQGATPLDDGAEPMSRARSPQLQHLSRTYVAEAAAPSPRAGAAPRLPGLDLLRAIAIAWVMLYHASNFGLASHDSWVIRFGWLGVDLFFVLSGFLIAGQLLRPWARGLRPDYPRFFARRLLRTLPAYLAIVALYFLVPAVRDRDVIQPLWKFLTFTQNFGLSPNPSKALSQAWSLCVEEQFYLVFPVVVALLALRPSAAKVVASVIGVLALGMVLRGWFWLHDVASGGSYMTLIYYPTWTRLDGLLAGIVAAAIQTFRPRIWQAAMARADLLLAVGAAGIAGSIFFFKSQIPGFWPAVLGYPMVSASMALVVAAASDRGSVVGRYAIPGAGALATGAYSLYLSHKMIFHAVRAASDSLPPVAQRLELPIALLGALAVGAALYWLVERPFLKLRDRLDGPSRSSLAAAPA
jgi:peptidoglycan/LPS O-acetylase OafA/YrhL